MLQEEYGLDDPSDDMESGNVDVRPRRRSDPGTERARRKRVYGNRP